jgi:hypothetical protein
MDPVWLEWFHMDGAELANRGRRPDHLDDEDDLYVALALAPYVDRHRPRTRPRSPSPSPSPPSHEEAGDDAATARNNKRACIPAYSEAILGLKEVVPTAKHDDDDCAICLNPLADIAGPDHKKDDASATSMLRAMPCSHIFHQHCIFQWLHRNTVCPLCRYQLPTTFEDEDTEVEKDEEETDNSNSRLNQIRRRLQILYN